MLCSCSSERNGVRAEATLTGGRPMEGAVTASPAPEQAAEVRCSPKFVASKAGMRVCWLCLQAVCKCCRTAEAL
jgi:hypothetical protein